MDRVLNPQNDVIFKRIFGTEKNKDILISFLNDMLEFRKKPAIVEVSLKNTYLLRDRNPEKLGIVDVLCVDAKGNHYIVELQVSGEAGFGARAEFYVSKLLSSQIKAGETYETLKEVIFLGILNFNLFHDKIPYKSEHLMIERNTGEHLLQKQTYVFLELDKFPKKIEDVDNLQGMIEKWTYFFKYAQKMDAKSWEHLLETAPASMQKAHDELVHSALSEEEVAEYEHVEKYRRDYLSIVNSHERKGKTEGLAEGEAKLAAAQAELTEAKAELTEAKAKSEAKLAEAKLEMVRNLLELGLDVDKISKVSGLSVAEITNLQEKNP